MRARHLSARPAAESCAGCRRYLFGRCWLNVAAEAPDPLHATGLQLDQAGAVAMPRDAWCNAFEPCRVPDLAAL